MFQTMLIIWVYYFLKSIRNLNGLANAEVSFYEGPETERGKKAEAISILKIVKSNSIQLVGQSDTGSITKVNDIGVFVTDICQGNYGLIHKNNLPNDYMKKYTRGQKVQVVVQRINKNGKLDLKLKKE